MSNRSRTSAVRGVLRREFIPVPVRIIQVDIGKKIADFQRCADLFFSAFNNVRKDAGFAEDAEELVADDDGIDVQKFQKALISLKGSLFTI